MSSSSSTSVEILTARGAGSNHRKGKRDFEKSKTNDREDLKKNPCVFYREEEHGKIDCSKFKMKESKSKANVTMTDGDNSDPSVLSLSLPFFVLQRHLSEF